YGTRTARLVALEALEEAPDVAILATKATGTAAAIEASRAALDGVPLLVVQNGLGGDRLAARLLGHDRVAGGIALMAANSMEPGVVTVTAAGDTIVGGPEGARFAALLGEGPSELRSVPEISDVRVVQGLLELHGVTVERDGDTLRLDPLNVRTAHETSINAHAGSSRIPILFCGPLLH
ncbi:hypothetical protein FV292_26530, partial [Escherichia coli]